MTRPRLLQWPLSVLFIGQMYLALAALAISFAPFVMWRREHAFDAVHAFCRWVRFTAWLLVGLRSEVRGEVPQGEVLVAAKHQSFFDIIIIVSVLPQPKFIMKKELMRAPFLGWYAKKLGCIPVDRGKRGQAVTQMVADVKAGTGAPSQLIIYPQGTRVAAGATKPYKVGTAVLYSQLGQTCIPVATNVGVFWPRRSMYRQPGLAVVEFLPPVASGMDQEAFLAQLEKTVEGHSDRLMAEAGFRVDAGE